MESAQRKKKPENYSFIKEITDNFRKQATDGELSLPKDQPLGYILSETDISEISKLQQHNKYVVLLFGLAGKKLTISALSCDEKGTINSEHYQGAKIPGQETWDADTATKQSPPIAISTGDGDFEKYMP